MKTFYPGRHLELSTESHHETRRTLRPVLGDKLDIVAINLIDEDNPDDVVLLDEPIENLELFNDGKRKYLVFKFRNPRRFDGGQDGMRDYPQIFADLRVRDMVVTNLASYVSLLVVNMNTAAFLTEDYDPEALTWNAYAAGHSAEEWHRVAMSAHLPGDGSVTIVGDMDFSEEDADSGRLLLGWRDPPKPLYSAWFLDNKYGLFGAVLAASGLRDPIDEDDPQYYPVDDEDEKVKIEIAALTAYDFYWWQGAS